MVRTFLVRGMLVGIVAGLLSFGFLKVFGEPQVDRAVAFETQQDEAKAAAHKADGHMHCTCRIMRRITRPMPMSPSLSADRFRRASAFSLPSLFIAQPLAACSASLTHSLTAASRASSRRRLCRSCWRRQASLRSTSTEP